MPVQSASESARNRLAWAVVTVIGWIVIVASPLALAAEADRSERAERPAGVSPEVIHQSIEQLDSDLFVEREEATRRLVEAGRPAIASLARAADGDQLETATRAVRILLQLTEADETATAREALAALAQLEHRPVERKAARAVLDQFRETRALAEIIRLGGTAKLRYTVAGRKVIGQLVLGRQWKGGDDDFRLVADIHHLQTLSVHGADVTDAGIAHLKGIAALQRIELYGTKVTRQGMAALKKSLPLADIDYRHGALLGIQGIGGTEGARITYVAPGSAAAKAGLKALDVVVSIDGQEVKDFKTLTELVGAHKPGDKARVEVLRATGRLTKPKRFETPKPADTEPVGAHKPGDKARVKVPRGTERLTIPVVYGGWQ
jgi:hypothetical protein